MALNCLTLSDRSTYAQRVKMSLACSQCPGTAPWIYGEYSDESILTATCRAGHSTVGVVRNPRYEMHFDFAACALNDGYYREAVSTVAVSLERFYEFYIETVCAKNGIPEDEYNKNWKNVDLSERQLGAFLFLYLTENKRACTFAPQDYIKLRNRVTHRGYFPKREEAIEYGQMALTFMTEMYAELESSCKNIIQERCIKRCQSLAATHAPTGNCVSSRVGTILNEHSRLKLTYEDWLARIQTYLQPQYTA
jgi:hypothetical protein